MRKQPKSNFKPKPLEEIFSDQRSRELVEGLLYGWPGHFLTDRRTFPAGNAKSVAEMVERERSQRKALVAMLRGEADPKWLRNALATLFDPDPVSDRVLILSRRSKERRAALDEVAVARWIANRTTPRALAQKSRERKVAYGIEEAMADMAKEIDVSDERLKKLRAAGNRKLKKMVV